MKAGENVKQAIMIGAGNIGRGFIGLLLEQAGCHVIYGLVGLKTHSKIALVVRR